MDNNEKLQWLRKFSTNFVSYQLQGGMRDEEVVSSSNILVNRNINNTAQISQYYDASPLQSLKQLDRCITWLVLATQ
jgi:hypothetical protein